MNFEYRILNQMTHMRRLLFISFLFISIFSFAQDDVTYKTPPKEILDLVMAKPTPGVNVDSKGEWMILTERSDFPTIEDMRYGTLWFWLELSVITLPYLKQCNSFFARVPIFRTWVPFVNCPLSIPFIKKTDRNSNRGFDYRSLLPVAHCPLPI